MASPLPSDPYEALGVPKDATSAAVKMAHRKLVLKCHPDKVTDPAEKQAASDKFHKIQSAYEILIDQSRRERYDAQVKLAELRKEAMARQSEGRPRGADVRSTSYRPEPPRSTYTSRGERVVPQYEERRPDYASDYFDAQPRATSRKEPEYAERAPPRRTTESKEKPRGFTRSSKESDKDRRKEKSRQTEREVRRDRERKREPQVEDDTESEDDYARRARRMREEDTVRRAREQYHEAIPRPQREPDVPYDDRARTMASQTAAAWDYIRSSGGGLARPRTEERRPSSVRMESTKDRLQSIKLDHGGRPTGFMRRGSERLAKDEKKREKETSRKTSSRTPERRSSAENVDERRPPTLNTSKSSPADIHIPSEKQRATSLQPGSAAMPPPPPQVKRSDTMPHSTSTRRDENLPPKSSRATEFTNGEPTPATTPENQAPPQKFPYSNRQYADETEYATPDGYRTSGPQERTRPSFARRVTRSPSPMKEASRESTRDYAPRSRESTYDSMPPRPRDFTREMPRSRESRESPQPVRDEMYPDMRDSRDARQPSYRTSSARYADRPQPMPTRTTSYVYTPATNVEPVSRMSPVREPSPRDAPLYGESPYARSPQQRPAEDGVRFAKPVRPENFKMASGYGYARPSGERPQVSRNNSGGVFHSARAQPA